MLTEPGDLVLDFFAGSNTTGRAAETAGRNWMAFEMNQQYLAASAFRFAADLPEHEAVALYQRLNQENAAGTQITSPQHLLAI
jgi:DNA modification methylase